MHPTIAAIIHTLGLIAERDGEPDATQPPAPPATDEAIARAQARHSGRLSPAYVDFLRRHDGWSDCPWGIQLFSAEDLCGEAYDWAREVLGYSEEAGDVPKELVEALLIGKNENGSDLIMLVDSGEVVHFLYEEVDRFADLDAWLVDRLGVVDGLLEDYKKAQDTADTQATPAWRAAAEAELLAELRAELADPAALPPAVPPLAESPLPPPVAPADLVIRDEDGSELAGVRLNLVLYLGAYPSRTEIVQTFRAFRRQFPTSGQQDWYLPALYYASRHTDADPDGEAWVDAIRPEATGLFGLRVSIGRYELNVCGIPPTYEDEPRASFCEVMLPPDEDPARLVALARELANLLPVRSGHGGFSAYVASGQDDDSYTRVFEWCRRFFGLDVGYLDGWLTAALRRVVGAGWLTVLGPTFAAVLPPFPSAGRTESGAVVIQAGPVPTLGDVTRGEFPVGQSEVDRYLAPLKPAGWRRLSRMMTAGHTFQITAEELPGGFREHRKTADWLRRLTDPAAFLAPSVRDRALALLGASETGQSLRQLLSDLTATEGIEALELVVSCPDDAPAQAFDKLLARCLAAGDVTRALSHVDGLLAQAPEVPSIYYNAACVYARAGDRPRALDLLALAKEHGVPYVAQAATDEDLRALWGDPRFVATLA